MAQKVLLALLVEATLVADETEVDEAAVVAAVLKEDDIELYIDLSNHEETVYTLNVVGAKVADAYLAKAVDPEYAGE